MEPVQSVQTNVYQSNTYRNDYASYISTMNQGFNRGGKLSTRSPVYLFLQLIQQFQVATWSTSLDMTTVFHIWLYGRFKDTEQPQEKETS